MHQAQLLASKAAKYTAEYFIAFVCISEGSYKTKNVFKRQKIFQKYFFALWGKHLQFDSDSHLTAPGLCDRWPIYQAVFIINFLARSSRTPRVFLRPAIYHSYHSVAPTDQKKALP